MNPITQTIKDWWFLRKIPLKELRRLVEKEIEKAEREFQDYCEKNT